MRTRDPLMFRCLVPCHARLTMMLSGIFLVLTGCETMTYEERHFSLPTEKSSHSILDSRLNTLKSDVEEYPKRHKLHYEIAAVHYQRQDYKQCVKALHKAIELSPTLAKYHYQLGRVYLHMGELEEAETCFRDACEHMPRNRYTGPRAALGYTLARREKLDEAIDEFKNCLEIEPENPAFYYFPGSLYDIEGDEENVIRYYSDYLARGGKTYHKKALFVLQRLGVGIRVDTDAEQSPAKENSYGLELPSELDASEG